jgi:hypothetical protein
MGEGNENLVYSSLWDFKRSLTRRKILRHGTSSLTSHAKEGVLRIFIALKNPSPWPGSNPRPLDPVASTLTTIPPNTSQTSYQNYVFRPSSKASGASVIINYAMQIYTLVNHVIGLEIRVILLKQNTI